MILRHHPVLTFFLCIALVITLLPLLGAVEPASAASGYIHGTVKNADGTALANIPVVVWRKDGGLCVIPKTNSGGYYNTGTIQDPDNKGFQVNANKNDQGDRNTRYQQQEKGPYSLGNPSGTVVDFYLPPATDTSKVTFSGTVVADVGSAPLQGINVFFWRQDNGDTFYATTDANGKFSVQKDKSTDPKKRYNIMANKNNNDGKYNSAWYNSTEQVNVLPDRDRSLYFRLPTGTVTFSGRVTDEMTGKGVNGLEVFLWRHDNGQSVYATTKNIGGYDGKWSIQVSRSVYTSNPDHRFNIMANKNNPGHYNSAYFNSTERVNILPVQDQSGLDFRVLSGTVKFDGMVYDQKTGKGIPGIEVYLWRHDGKSWKASTGTDGKWSAPVDRSSFSSNPDHRINVVANPYGSGHTPNPAYLNSTDAINKLPDRDQSISYFYLYSSTVTFDGMVNDQKTGKGIPGIEVYLWRHDGKSWKVSTGTDGKWSAPVDRSSFSSNPDHRINVVANPYGSGHTPNPAYLNSTDAINKLPDQDRSLSYFYLYSSTVLFSGNVTDDKTSTGIVNIGVQMKRTGDGATFCARTNTRGMWMMAMPRSSDTNQKYTITPNPNNACQPWNAGYTTASPRTSGTPDYDQANINFYLKAQTTPVTTTVPPTIPPTTTPTTVPPYNPNNLDVKNVKGEMISPNEFGIGVSATYPVSLPQAQKRYLSISTTINGKPLIKTYDVTQYTSPGAIWQATLSGDHVASNTPLRINLATEGVSRFTTDLLVPVTVTASYEGGSETKSSGGNAAIYLPVIFFHGACPPKEYPHCSVPYLPDDLANFAGYNFFTRHLLSRGYNEGSGYRTLYAPGTSSAMYTNPMRATPDMILNDVQGWVDQAKAGSYADHVNLVGHSFGGLVSQFYASQRPGNVNKVITVGTPFKGITNIYEVMFSEMKNRGMVDTNITTPGGQPNLILWGVPKDYTAFTLPPNPPAGINVQVTNSYNYAPQSSVEYHYIFATNVPTGKTVTLELNPDGQWFHFTSETTGPGDGTVLDFSASNTPGPTTGNIYRHPLQVDHIEHTDGIIDPFHTTHGSLFMDDIVHQEVVKALFRGTPIENTW